MKEILDYIVKNNIVIKITNEEDLDELHKILHENGFTWGSGRSYMDLERKKSSINSFLIPCKHVCYCIKEGNKGIENHYSNYIIEDFTKLFNLELLNLKDLLRKSKLIDEKYLILPNEGKWVIENNILKCIKS